jgi:hypothetical protein
MSFAMANARIVKGAPYSALAVSEFHQTLSDGNHIDRSRTTLLFRDGEGRTRQETMGTHPMIFLNDVTSGRRYVLDPARKTALLLSPDGHGPAPENSGPGMLGSVGAVFHRTFNRIAVATGLSDPDPIEQGRPAPDVPQVGGFHGPEPAGDFHTFGPPPGPPPGGAPPGPPPGPPPPGLGPDLGPLPTLPLVLREARGPGTVSSLGSKEFDGVRADGTRTTWTIAAGQIGNEKPIVLTSDQWYAPDLLLVVATRDSDPRDGETLYQVRDLKRSEPSPELFAVPPDYTVTSGVSPMGHPGTSRVK